MKRIGQGVLAGLWIVSAGAGAVMAADQTAPRVEEVRLKAAQVESYKADFALTVKESADKSATLTGTILYQRPDKRRIEFAKTTPVADDVAQLVVSDGVTEWQYFPGRRLANQTTWAKVKAAGAPPEALEVRGLHQPFIDVKRDTIRLLETKQEGGTALYVFEAEPSPTLVAEAPFPPGKLRVAVAAADGLTRWLTMTDATGREVLTQQYTKVQTKIPAKPEQFTFTPPQGVQVVDISEERARAAEPPAAPAGARP